MREMVVLPADPGREHGGDSRAWPGRDGTHLLLAPSRALQEDVHAVVIVGGGARIPKIQEKIKILMKRDTLNRNLNGALPWLFPQALRHADQIRSDS